MNSYTDADVRVALGIDMTMPPGTSDAERWRAILDAVAPAIAARAKAEALREAARAVSARTTPGHASIGPDGRRLERRAIATMLRARALSARVDEIEAGR